MNTGVGAPHAALADHKFSAASDVWAYGVLVHEIFTYGAQPYAEVGSTNHVIDYVTSGADSWMHTADV